LSVVTGAFGSGLTVKSDCAVFPALSIATTVCGPLSPPPFGHVYVRLYGDAASSVSTEGLKPPESPGNVTFRTPDSASLVVALTVKVLPAPPGRYQNVLPLT
jgi:hypothetical protein